MHLEQPVRSIVSVTPVGRNPGKQFLPQPPASMLDRHNRDPARKLLTPQTVALRGRSGEKRREERRRRRSSCSPFPSNSWYESFRRVVRQILLQTHRPRPVPTSFLVVTKGSNTWERMLVGMPGPLSAIVSRTPAVRFAPIAAETRMRMRPPRFTASMLLLRRFATSWRTSPGMA